MSGEAYVSQLDRCPSCDAEWAYYSDPVGTRYSRVIGIYSREQDRTVEWACPACGKRWDRNATVPSGSPCSSTGER